MPFPPLSPALQTPAQPLATSGSHVSFETAYLNPLYPYGEGYFCSSKHWVETVRFSYGIKGQRYRISKTIPYGQNKSAWTKFQLKSKTVADLVFLLIEPSTGVVTPYPINFNELTDDELNPHTLAKYFGPLSPDQLESVNLQLAKRQD